MKKMFLIICAAFFITGCAGLPKAKMIKACKTFADSGEIKLEPGIDERVLSSLCGVAAGYLPAYAVLIAMGSEHGMGAAVSIPIGMALLGWFAPDFFTYKPGHGEMESYCSALNLSDEDRRKALLMKDKLSPEPGPENLLCSMLAAVAGGFAGYYAADYLGGNTLRIKSLENYIWKFVMIMGGGALAAWQAWAIPEIFISDDEVVARVVLEGHFSGKERIKK